MIKHAIYQMTRISNKCSLVTSNYLQYFRFFHRFIVMTARDSHEFLKFAGPLRHHHLVLIHRLIDSGHTFEDKLCVLSFVPAPAAWPWRQRIAQHDLRSGAWKAAGLLSAARLEPPTTRFNKQIGIRIIPGEDGNEVMHF